MKLSDKLINLLNDQINKELFASYQYLAFYSYLNSSDISLQNIANYFLEESIEEKKHAMDLIKYINNRDGIVDYNIINKPINNTQLKKINIVYDLKFIFEYSLQLEQDFYNNLHSIAEEADISLDYHLNDFITSKYLSEQIDSIDKLKRILTKITMISKDSNPYSSIIQFDKHINK